MTSNTQSRAARIEAAARALVNHSHRVQPADESVCPHYYYEALREAIHAPTDPQPVAVAEVVSEWSSRAFNAVKDYANSKALDYSGHKRPEEVAEKWAEVCKVLDEASRWDIDRAAAKVQPEPAVDRSESRGKLKELPGIAQAPAQGDADEKLRRLRDEVRQRNIPSGTNDPMCWARAVIATKQMVCEAINDILAEPASEPKLPWDALAERYVNISDAPPSKPDVPPEPTCGQCRNWSPR